MRMGAFLDRLEAANRINEPRNKDGKDKKAESKPKETRTPQEIIEADRHRKPEARLSDML